MAAKLIKLKQELNKQTLKTKYENSKRYIFPYKIHQKQSNAKVCKNKKCRLKFEY